MSPADRFLEGHHAVITGGGRGIGRATARALGEAGANLTLLGRSAPHLEAEANHIAGQSGVRVEAITTDVTQDDQVRQAFETAERALGAPTILVNNAGQAEGAPFIRTSRELWDRMLAVNLTAAFTCIKQVLPAMLDAGRGRIISEPDAVAAHGRRRVRHDHRRGQRREPHAHVRRAERARADRAGDAGRGRGPAAAAAPGREPHARVYGRDFRRCHRCRRSTAAHIAGRALLAARQ